MKVVSAPHNTSASVSDETLARALRRNDKTGKMLHALALPQFFLAILALTSYHVQIITRLSSGYPVWYIWLASMIVEESNRVLPLFGISKRQDGMVDGSTGILVLRYLEVYGLVQAGLFSSFLPPA